MSGYYPLIEITTGFLFAITGMVVFGFAPGQFVYNTYIAYLLVYLLFLNSIFIVVFFTDLKYGLIPFNAVLIGVLVTFGWHIWTHEAGMSILNYIFSAGGSFVAFLSIFAITKGKGMGFGDVMYVFLMGAILGFPKVIVAFYISFISGAVISLLLILLKKKKMKGGTIPFGPFLVSGTVISLFWGDIILKKILPYLLG